MRLAIVLATLVAAGCIETVDPRWQLDHDHVVAVRATPPRVMPYERSRLEALIAHEGGAVTVEQPTQAVGPDEPAELHDLVAYIDGWSVTAPSAEALAAARVKLGLAPEAAVPLEVLMAFERPEQATLYAKKTVWLGDRGDNPTVPNMAVDGRRHAAELITVPMETDVYVSIPVAADARVNWLTSVGSLFQDDVSTAFLRVLPDDRTDGELAVVVRAADGGTAWRVWPIRAIR